MTLWKNLPATTLFTLVMLQSAAPAVHAQAPAPALPPASSSAAPAPQPPVAAEPQAPAAVPAPQAPAAPTASASDTSSTDQKPAQQKKRGFEVPKIGIDYDVFLPTSGKTRSRFGSSWGGIGIGIGRPGRPSGKGRVSFDFSSEYRASGDHHAFMAPIGIGYRRAFNPEDVADINEGVRPTFVPYYGVSADLVVVDLRSPEDNVHSRFRLTEGGSLVLGTTIGASGFIEGKYLAIGKVQGFDLSGIRLAVGVRF